MTNLLFILSGCGFVSIGVGGWLENSAYREAGATLQRWGARLLFASFVAGIFIFARSNL